MKIAIIGAGNLGLSIAKGLIISDTITQLYLTKRHTNAIKKWSEYKNVIVSKDNREAVRNSDILVFSSQPSQLLDILSEIKNLLTEKHLIISTAAGFDIKKIETIVGNDQYIVRAMPNTAISVGKSMTCICSNEKGQKRIDIVKAIFNKMGTSVDIPESLMRSATVICASGIAFWLRLIRATSQGATQLGFETEEALKLSTYTCLGAVSLLLESGKHPEEEIDKVTTPQGCTIEGLNEMEHSGLSSSLIKGLVASYDKINSLSKS